MSSNPFAEFDDRRSDSPGSVPGTGIHRQVGSIQSQAGQQVTVRLDGHLAHVTLDGRLVKTMPSPVPASTLHRLQGARAAVSPLQAPHGRHWFNGGSPAKAASRSPARSSRSAMAMPADHHRAGL